MAKSAINGVFYLLPHQKQGLCECFICFALEFAYEEEAGKKPILALHYLNIDNFYFSSNVLTTAYANIISFVIAVYVAGTNRPTSPFFGNDFGLQVSILAIYHLFVLYEMFTLDKAIQY